MSNEDNLQSTCYRFYTCEKHSSCVLQGGNTSIANTGQPYKILGALLQILSGEPPSRLTAWLRPPSSHILCFCNGRRVQLKHKTDRFEISSSDRLPGQVTWSSAMHYVSDRHPCFGVAGHKPWSGRGGGVLVQAQHHTRHGYAACSTALDYSYLESTQGTGLDPPGAVSLGNTGL